MILAGDIGGTKVNLASFELQNGKLVRGIGQTFRSRDYGGLEEIVNEFLREHRLLVDCACFGVAGPVQQGRAQPTNLSWVMETGELRKNLQIEHVWLINDLHANAYGIDQLPPADFVTLNRGNADPSGNQAIIAAGTGLGEAGLVRGNGVVQAVPSEGGHADFAPRTDLDMELLRYLRARFGQVSWEDVLSGPGFFHIYQFLRDSGRGQEPDWLAAQFNEMDPPVAITRAALDRSCDLCIQTMDLFVTYYGAEAANLALKMLATGGIYVGGGIAPKIIEKLEDGTFMKAFIGAGRLKNLLARMPVHVILNPEAPLIGAGWYAAVKCGRLATSSPLD